MSERIIATYILVIAIFILFVFVPKEEVNRGALDFDRRMRAPQSNNRHRLCIRPANHALALPSRFQPTTNSPNTFLPQLLRQHYSPHRIIALMQIHMDHSLSLPFVAYYPNIHALFDHTEKHRLHSSVEFVVFSSHVRGADVGENGFTDKSAQSR